PGWGLVPTREQLSLAFGPRGQVLPRARSRSRPPRRPRAAAGPPSVASLRGDKRGGWFPPAKTSVSRSARAARYYHELAAARAPLGGPERPPVPPASLRSGGTRPGVVFSGGMK